ncbi:hypothetical protein AVEN_255907-1 [Araneus ventricosus]|uniref:DUF4817 domain-containing protein n=1 Tax=Araneus ventricosus TaxID=182803 RepID=A0A4Y2PGI7_ARAVE|nr:hypothetical protein AVEN_255907-1 [Araneus ventricosus]
MRSVLRLRGFSVHSYTNTEELHLVTKAFCVGFESFVKLVVCVKGKSMGRPRISEEIVERVRQSFVHSPQKSTIRASHELDIPQKTVWNVLHRLLHFKPYRLQLLQHPIPDDYAHHFDFCIRMQQAIEDDDALVGTLIFSDEATFHLSGKMNCHNDGAPPHWSTIDRDFLNRELPHRWIGHAGLDDVPLLPCFPRSPDLMPRDFFLWGYVNGKVYLPPMPTTLQALQERITAAVTNIDKKHAIGRLDGTGFRDEIGQRAKRRKSKNSSKKHAEGIIYQFCRYNEISHTS